MNKLSDQWQTPTWLFDELDKEFNFRIDLCANERNCKSQFYFEDYLTNKNPGQFCVNEYETFEFIIDNLNGEFSCFMNPPYSNPKPFIEKAWEDSKHCKIVCLVKCDPSTKWWATFWDYNIVHYYNSCREGMCGKIIQNDYLTEEQKNGKRYACAHGWTTEAIKKIYSGPKPGCEVRFLPKRVQFDPPQQLIDSGEVWKVGNKWAKECEHCIGTKTINWPAIQCTTCKGKGYIELSGPTFSSALVIMDRRKEFLITNEETMVFI